ncbi:uncharacterized protein MELLADRAFT_110012 [Melampsora larici-populina 98AG31]|uniref:Uncharacterized protein n=1 Tax=Melampsora larici-populina (strain 98AG31 / pathotype 3-4-7) TaxID=747676 RepID=F4RYC7_MELLP|nr:uncharacterized protein MELLADRAFT_110012 [Melampsora larici-populina 98AG31]EGG02658.1 hypothetical protein MELLADRAFT_110012 [Melampsora larici-populina 98AG31]
MAGRGKTRARRAANGTPQTNTKSKTKPSAIAYRDRKRQERDIGTPFPQKHQGRVDKRRALAEELGLPPETKFIFRHRITDPEEQKKREIVELHFGTTAVINKEDNSLILATGVAKREAARAEAAEAKKRAREAKKQLASSSKRKKQ